MNRLKISKGDWIPSSIADKEDTLSVEIYGVHNWTVCVSLTKTLTDRDNFKLIADAGNTYNKCKTLPSELLKQNLLFIEQNTTLLEKNRELMQENQFLVDKRNTDEDRDNSIIKSLMKDKRFLTEDRERLVSLLSSILLVSLEEGKENCTYGETKHDSISVAYGHNTLLEFLQNKIRTTLDKLISV